MKMTTKVYRNGEQVNEIETTDPTEIYKKIAQIYKAREDKRTTRTTTKTSWGRIEEATETFNQDKTQLAGIKYKYHYIFESVEL